MFPDQQHVIPLYLKAHSENIKLNSVLYVILQYLIHIISDYSS